MAIDIIYAAVWKQREALHLRKKKFTTDGDVI